MKVDEITAVYFMGHMGQHTATHDPCDPYKTMTLF